MYITRPLKKAGTRTHSATAQTVETCSSTAESVPSTKSAKSKKFRFPSLFNCMSTQDKHQGKKKQEVETLELAHQANGTVRPEQPMTRKLSPTGASDPFRARLI